MPCTPFQGLNHVDASLRGAMGKIGIGSVEEFLSLWQIPQLQKHICQLLGVEREQVGRMTADLQTHIAPESRRLLEPIPAVVLSTFLFGALENTDSGAPLCAEPILDSRDLYLSGLDSNQVSLIPRMTPIRSQGSRGACVAFAAAALREFFLRREALSPQFLYWACKERDGIPDTEGTWLSVALQVLQEKGVCAEADWPYNPEPGSTRGQGPPPEGAEEKAARYKVLEGIRYAPGAVNDIRACLSEGKGRPVAISVPVYASWIYNPLVYRTGEIRDPLPGEEPLGGHAMVVVGMDDSARRFYVRNSWGTSWASESPLGPGYGTISYQYIAAQGREAFTARARDEHNIFHIGDFRPFKDPRAEWARPVAAVLSILLAILFFVHYGIQEPQAAKDCTASGPAVASAHTDSLRPSWMDPGNPGNPFQASAGSQRHAPAGSDRTTASMAPGNKKEDPKAGDGKDAREDDRKFERLAAVLQLLKQTNEAIETMFR